MPMEIRRATTGEERDRCYQVRMAVFVEEQKVPPWEEMDHLDEDADHYLVEYEGRVVATARLVDRGDSTGKIGRVAVLREYRGRGIGRDLMRHVIRQAASRHARLVLDAQLQVIPFYERLGFVAEGDDFLDAGIEHRRMNLDCRAAIRE
jgi:ElaA protein